MGFSMNCDAIEFMGGSVNPGYLFHQNYSRQSRPLYLIAGSIAGYTLYYLTTPFHQAINKKASSWFSNQIPDEDVSLYLSHYAGLILINLLVLIFSLLLFEKIIIYATGNWKNGRILKYALFLLLISTHITKTFFWTPHQQMFNTILPLLCIWLFIKIINNDFSNRQLFLLSLLNGILVLLYGSFLLLLPIFLIAIFYKHIKTTKQPFKNVIKSAFISFIAFCIPILSWILILKILTIDFYSHETFYFREFVWVLDALKDSQRNLVAEMSANAFTYLKTTAILIFPLVFLVLSLALKTNNRIQSDRIKSNLLNHIFIMNALLLLVFFFFLGYYTDRLTYTLCPLFITYGAIQLNKNSLTQIKITGIILLILIWHFFLLFNEMPHFSNRFYH